MRPTTGRRPLASPEIASGNARNTSRQIFRSAEIVIRPAILELGQVTLQERQPHAALGIGELTCPTLSQHLDGLAGRQAWEDLHHIQDFLAVVRQQGQQDLLFGGSGLG